jgi:hypothetical protein
VCYFTQILQNQPNLNMKYLITCIVCLFSCVLTAQDPDIPQIHGENADGEWVYRTSDEEGEVPSNAFERVRRRKVRVSEPEGAVRIGCVCMNGKHSDAHSSGACSGFGGVRFWIYQLPSEDTVWIMTHLHQAHPDTLNTVELSKINDKKKSKTGGGVPSAALAPIPIIVQYPPMPPQPMVQVPEWVWPLALVLFGLLLLLTVRLVLEWITQNDKLFKDALSHFLRHKRRQGENQNGKDIGSTRLP